MEEVSLLHQPSGRHRRRLRRVVVVGRSVSGNRNDCKAWELSDAKATVGRTTVIADGGYRGTGLVRRDRHGDPGLYAAVWARTISVPSFPASGAGQYLCVDVGEAMAFEQVGPGFGCVLPAQYRQFTFAAFEPFPAHGLGPYAPGIGSAWLKAKTAPGARRLATSGKRCSGSVNHTAPQTE